MVEIKNSEINALLLKGEKILQKTAIQPTDVFGVMDELQKIIAFEEEIEKKIDAINGMGELLRIHAEYNIEADMFTQKYTNYIRSFIARLWDNPSEIHMACLKTLLMLSDYRGLYGLDTIKEISNKNNDSNIKQVLSDPDENVRELAQQLLKKIQ